MKVITYFTISLSVLGSFFLASPFEVVAQSFEAIEVEVQNDFVVGPGKTEVVLEPGASVTRQVRITSRIPGSTTFALSVEDFIGSQDPQQTVQLLGDEIGPYSLQDFITLPTNEITLDFGQRVTIPVTITVPEGAEPGGRYGAVVVSNAPSRIQQVNQNTSGAVIVSRIGSLFLVRVEGTVKESGQLSDFRIPLKRSVYWNGAPENFELLFSNDGSVHLVPYGYIEIKNIFGSVVDQIPVEAYFALPNSLRSRVVEWVERPILFGYYRAELTLNRGYDDLVDKKGVSFWILPWQPVLIGILAILLLATFITLLAKKFEIKRK